jgi:DNA polymerase V
VDSAKHLLADVGSAPVPITSERRSALLELAWSVQAGFPSPAEDFNTKRVDLTEILITHPQATFLARVAGWSMKDDGIWDRDVIVVNRAIKPKHNHIVLAVVDGEHTVKRLHLRHGRFRLVAANSTFPDIVPAEGQTVEIWGVVTSCIKQFAV